LTTTATSGDGDPDPRQDVGQGDGWGAAPDATESDDEPVDVPSVGRQSAVGSGVMTGPPG